MNPWRYIAEKSGEEIVEKSSDGAALAEEKNWWAHLDSNPLRAKSPVHAKVERFPELWLRRAIAA